MPQREGFYSGAHASPDPSSWDKPVATSRDREAHPPPATYTDGKRAVTPDPYKDPDNPNVKRNFGHH